MVEPRPPFAGRRRPRIYNFEEIPGADNISEEQQAVQPFARRRRQSQFGQELRDGEQPSGTEQSEAPQLFGRRRMRVENLPVGDDSKVQETVEVPMQFGRRSRQINQDNTSQLPGTLGVPENTSPRRRRVEPSPMTGPGLSPQVATPPVPPVESKSARRSESLLESIIKLVNSILTFKGK